MCRSAAAGASTAASTGRAASARSPIRSTLVCGNSRAAAEAARLFGVSAMPVHTVGTSPGAHARLVECAGLAGPGPVGSRTGRRGRRRGRFGRARRSGPGCGVDSPAQLSWLFVVAGVGVLAVLGASAAAALRWCGEDSGMASGAAAVGVSAWAPLRVRAFRALWIAQLASMIGTWMQTVGAQWLLVGEPNAAMLVALVQTAAMVPTLMLALPAGALGDIVDRRRLLIGLQGFQLVVGAVLVAFTLVGRLAPAPLLVLTFLLGCGQALTVPGYQALVQDLVPRAQLRSA